MMFAALVAPARRFGLRRLRLTTGLILFTYVALHLTNHALGNLSVEAMEAGLVLQKFLWQGVLGTLALYLALATHFSLGLWAFYQRRHYGWTGPEVLQLILGLSIPILLINHLVVTRIAYALYDLEKGYAQELYSFHIQNRFFGWVQLSVLVVAWIHGCLGVYFWLRLKPLFRRWAPTLTACAVLLPVLALLGYAQGGRRILELATDPAWRVINLAPEHTGSPEENAWLTAGRNGFLWCYGATLLAILAARFWRLLRETGVQEVRIAYPHGRSVTVPLGFSVLEASLKAGIPHAHVCGGRGRCSTCRIRVIGGAAQPAPSPVEQAVLDRVGAAPGTRLACQLRPCADLSVAPLLPPGLDAGGLGNAVLQKTGEERHIAVMVVDMRDSTRLGEQRLPFDTVFIVDRFIEAIGGAVARAGGRPSQFTGDGMLALFGIDTGPDEACAQALRAAVEIGAAVERLNHLLAEDLSEPIRFGLGLYAGVAVVGEIGYGATRIFTALGQPPNLASRLEGLCKQLGVEAVIADDVCRLSGFDLAALSAREVELRGHAGTIRVRTAAKAANIVLERAKKLRDGGNPDAALGPSVSFPPH